MFPSLPNTHLPYMHAHCCPGAFSATQIRCWDMAEVARATLEEPQEPPGTAGLYLHNSSCFVFLMARTIGLSLA